MLRKIIEIDEALCNGCGVCANACQEGAIGMVNGKAKLLRDDYCDGLGNCLPACPTGAIRFVEREAAAYDDLAVEEHKAQKDPRTPPMEPLACGCPGTHARSLERPQQRQDTPAAAPVGGVSQLAQWPVQIKLAPVNAPYFKNARLLVAADCSAFACGDFHERFMKNHVTLIGCPKLDGVDYAEKLTAILKQNEVRSIRVVRMEVPCCGGLEHAVRTALQASGKMIPWEVVTLSTEGDVLE